MKSGKVLLGVLAGLATGAALGILFAPDKGSATRKKISKRAKNMLMSSAKSTMNSLLELKINS